MTKFNNFKYKNCQICGSKKLDAYLDLGYQPTVNDFTKISDNRVTTEFYPLKIVLCNSCELLQLDTKIDTKKIFPPNYAYRSGTTNILIQNFLNLAKDIEKTKILKPKDKILDIGSNDGTLLSSFDEQYFKLGVEPTDVAKLAKKKVLIQFKHHLALSYQIN